MEKNFLKKSFWITIFQALKNRFAKKIQYLQTTFLMLRGGGLQISFNMNFPKFVKSIISFALHSVN